MSGTPSSPAAVPKSKRPSENEFMQQRLPAWQPILTPRWVVATFLLIGIPFVILGFVLKAASDGVIELSVPYDGVAATSASVPSYASMTNCKLPVDPRSSPPSNVPGSNATCQITFNVPMTMSPPVYIYYGLDNFYQNHRRYVKSKSDSQLAGTILGEAFTQTGPLSSCDPLVTTGNKLQIVNNPGQVGKVLYPCGLIANSFFNDTFKLTTAGLVMSETGISWASDRDKKFKSVPANYYGLYSSQVQFLNDTYPGLFEDFTVENEHFIVWMRPAALPSFRKLYGRIDTAVQAGTVLSFNVSANFPVLGFQGSKYLVVSTLSWVGGKNPFLGIAYLVVGFACIAMAAFFSARMALGVGRKLGDTSYLVNGGTRRGTRG